MQDLSCFTLSVQDHVAHLVLNRPEAMNTMGPVFWRELDAVLTELHHGNAARANDQGRRSGQGGNLFRIHSAGIIAAHR